MNDQDSTAIQLSETERAIVGRLVSRSNDPAQLAGQIAAADVIARSTSPAHRIHIDVRPDSAERGSPDASYFVRSRFRDEDLNPAIANLSIARGWLNYLEISRLDGSPLIQMPEARDLADIDRVEEPSGLAVVGAWTPYSPRPLLDDEWKLLDRMLSNDVEDLKELREQVAATQVVAEYVNTHRALELEVDRTRAPRSAILGGVPVEADWALDDGFPFQVLVHVYHGWLSELEINSPDGRAITRLPRPDEIISVRASF